MPELRALYLDNMDEDSQFQNNRIYCLRRLDITNAPKLEHLDMRGNHVGADYNHSIRPNNVCSTRPGLTCIVRSQ